MKQAGGSGSKNKQRTTEKNTQRPPEDNKDNQAASNNQKTKKIKEDRQSAAMETNPGQLAEGANRSKADVSQADTSEIMSYLNLEKDSTTELDVSDISKRTPTLKSQKKRQGRKKVTFNIKNKKFSSKVEFSSKKKTGQESEEETNLVGNQGKNGEGGHKAQAENRSSKDGKKSGQGALRTVASALKREKVAVNVTEQLPNKSNTLDLTINTEPENGEFLDETIQQSDIEGEESSVKQRLLRRQTELAVDTSALSADYDGNEEDDEDEENGNENNKSRSVSLNTSSTTSVASMNHSTILPEELKAELNQTTSTSIAPQNSNNQNKRVINDDLLSNSSTESSSSESEELTITAPSSRAVRRRGINDSITITLKHRELVGSHTCPSGLSNNISHTLFYRYAYDPDKQTKYLPWNLLTEYIWQMYKEVKSPPNAQFQVKLCTECWSWFVTGKQFSRKTDLRMHKAEKTYTLSNCYGKKSRAENDSFEYKEKIVKKFFDRVVKVGRTYSKAISRGFIKENGDKYLMRPFRLNPLTCEYPEHELTNRAELIVEEGFVDPEMMQAAGGDGMDDGGIVDEEEGGGGLGDQLDEGDLLPGGESLADMTQRRRRSLRRGSQKARIEKLKNLLMNGKTGNDAEAEGNFEADDGVRDDQNNADSTMNNSAVIRIKKESFGRSLMKKRENPSTSLSQNPLDPGMSPKLEPMSKKKLKIEKASRKLISWTQQYEHKMEMREVAMQSEMQGLKLRIDSLENSNKFLQDLILKFVNPRGKGNIDGQNTENGEIVEEETEPLTMENIKQEAVQGLGVAKRDGLGDQGDQGQ